MRHVSSFGSDSFYSLIKALLKDVKNSISSGICRSFLSRCLVSSLSAIRIVADRFGQDPFPTSPMRSGVYACAFHLSANCFRCKRSQLFPVVNVVHELIATEK